MKVKDFIIFSLLVLMTSCGKKQSNTDTIAPVKVAIEEAGTSASSNSKEYVGEIQAESSTAVSSISPATVSKVLIEEGQKVTKGQIVAMMDPAQNKSALNSARAAMAQAKDAYQRMKVLHDKKAISEMDWVSVQAKMQQAQSAVEMCEKSLKDCTIKAPCSGVIGKKNIESGMTVLPTQPICTIINIKEVKVKVAVPEKELMTFTPNTKTTISVKSIKKTFKGGHIETGVEGNSISRTYNVYIHMGNPGEVLRPGMVCDVNVFTGKSSDKQKFSIITLPVTAVHRRASGDMFVWKDINGVAKRTVIQVGSTYGDRIEILGGVSLGDKVITDGYQKLSDGSTVTVVKD